MTRRSAGAVRGLMLMLHLKRGQMQGQGLGLGLVDNRGLAGPMPAAAEMEVGARHREHLSVAAAAGARGGGAATECLP